VRPNSNTNRHLIRTDGDSDGSDLLVCGVAAGIILLVGLAALVLLSFPA